MEAFKLLSRSTNLKRLQSSKDERGAKHVPSEGQRPSAAVDAHRTIGNPSWTVCAVKKRKRDASHLADGKAEVLRSSLSDNETAALGRQVDVARESSNETPSEDVSTPDISEPPKTLSPDECRSVFRSHKVKIATLEGLVSDATSAGIDTHQKSYNKIKTSKLELLSKKRQKEVSKLYIQPLTSFPSLKTTYSASRTLVDNIREQGYRTPTEVQLATIPLLLDPAAAGLQLPSGCCHVNLLTVAPTGSGKTLAFLVPLINSLVQDHHQTTAKISSRGITALIVAPTKELVGQILNEGRKLCRNTGVSIAAMRKGMHIHTQSDDTSFPDSDGNKAVFTAHELSITVKADILVTTPLVVANAITKENSDLPSIRHLILDEADVLLDPLFREQTLSLWNACTNTSLRVTLWSATIGSNVEEMVIDLVNERHIRLGIKTKTPLLRCIVGLKDSALPTISHKLIYAATEPGKLLGLRQLLHPPTTFDGNHTTAPLRPPLLVFTQTIERAVALHAELLYDIPTEAGGSSRIAVLHSDLSDLKRSEIMARFRKAQIWVLITTDLLSRGVDFRGVNGVVNYDIPTSSAAYVHRVGRTGRAGREGGTAVTFYTKEDVKYVKAIANAIAASEKARGKAGDGKGEDVQGWLLKALPDISKKDRQDLKKRGVGVRRKVRAGEDDTDAKAKRKARISTKSGYERRLKNDRKGAIAGGRARLEDAPDEGESEGWSGLDK